MGSQVFNFKSTWRVNGTSTNSQRGKSDGIVPPEPFSCYATEAKVNTLPETLMESTGALHLPWKRSTGVVLIVGGDIMASSLKNE